MAAMVASESGARPRLVWMITPLALTTRRRLASRLAARSATASAAGTSGSAPERSISAR